MENETIHDEKPIWSENSGDYNIFGFKVDEKPNEKSHPSESNQVEEEVNDRGW